MYWFAWWCSLCPSLFVISKALHLSQNVAGATLVAFGNGSVDIFAAISGIRQGRPDLVIGDLLGAYNHLNGVPLLFQRRRIHTYFRFLCNRWRYICDNVCDRITVYPEAVQATGRILRARHYLLFIGHQLDILSVYICQRNKTLRRNRYDDCQPSCWPLDDLWFLFSLARWLTLRPTMSLSRLRAGGSCIGLHRIQWWHRAGRSWAWWSS